ncbi:hypothetical protein Pint_21749 [Pistacia integerrima]|uniref:Uncharacterized protein n=1 Tax=Pistacia integerrima TaxID=434235 RepID=A0ACC0XBB8_9ROSI|nr:hypothetical protein Pint_21749 [Pistacia integerrima]
MEDSGKIKKQEDVVKVKQKPKEEALRNLHKFKTAKLSGFYIMHLEDRPLKFSAITHQPCKCDSVQWINWILGSCLFGIWSREAPPLLIQRKLRVGQALCSLTVVI